MPISAGQQWLLLFVHYVLMPTPIMIQRERMTSRGNNTKSDSICKVGKKQTFCGEEYERGCSELKLEIPSKILAKKWQHNDTFEELRITNGWTEGLKWTHLQVTSKGWQAARIQKEKKYKKFHIKWYEPTSRQHTVCCQRLKAFTLWSPGYQSIWTMYAQGGEKYKNMLVHKYTDITQNLWTNAK